MIRRRRRRLTDDDASNQSPHRAFHRSIDRERERSTRPPTTRHRASPSPTHAFVVPTPWTTTRWDVCVCVSIDLLTVHDSPTSHTPGPRRIDRWRVGMGRMPIRVPRPRTWSTFDYIAFTRIEYECMETHTSPYERHVERHQCPYYRKDRARGRPGRRPVRHHSHHRSVGRRIDISTRDRTNERTNERRWLSPSRASLPRPGASLDRLDSMTTRHPFARPHHRSIHRSYRARSYLGRGMIRWDANDG